MTDYGYTGKILRINLSDGKIDYLDTSGYAERFLGGRGMAAKIFWDETSPEMKALEPGNCLIFIYRTTSWIYQVCWLSVADMRKIGSDGSRIVLLC